MGTAESLKKEAISTAEKIMEKNIDTLPIKGMEFFVVTTRNTIPDSLLVDVFFHRGTKYRLFHLLKPVNSNER